MHRDALVIELNVDIVVQPVLRQDQTKPDKSNKIYDEGNKPKA